MSATLETVKALTRSLEEKGEPIHFASSAVRHLQTHPEDRATLTETADRVRERFPLLKVAVGGFCDPEDGSMTITINVLTRGDHVNTSKTVFEYADDLQSLLPSGTPYIIDAIQG